MVRKPQTGLRLQTQLAITFSLAGILVAGIVTTLIFLNFRTQLREITRQNLKNVAQVATLLVDSKTHADLQNASQEGSSSYVQVKKSLQSVRDSGLNLRYVYTMRRQADGSFIFVVDAEENPGQISHLGDLYPNTTPSMLAVYISGMTMVDPDFTSDAWGTWLSAFAPIYDSSGQIESILGIDMDASEVIANERQYLWISLSVFALSIPLFIILGWFLGGRLASPLVTLTQGARRIAAGELNYRMSLATGAGEASELAAAFNSMTEKLQETVGHLEQRVDQRTQELADRTQALEAAVAVSKTTTALLDPESLIHQVVETIQDCFNLYYVGLFLTDTDQEWAVLRAGTGQAGQAMLDRDHRIKIGAGMIGWSVANNQARVAQRAEEDAVRLVNPELPDTRAEAAIPLRSRGRVIGALTVQSTEAQAFHPEALAILQTMADQVAIAIDNSWLFSENQRNLEAVQAAYKELNKKTWAELIEARSGLTFHCDESGVSRISPEEPDPKESEVLPEISFPILIRGQKLGSLEARKPSDSDWSKEEIGMVEKLVEQLNVALETARLYEETQRRGERERLASEITAKLRASNDPAVILQVAARELRQVLGADKAQVLLHARKGGNLPSNHGNGHKKSESDRSS